MLDMEVNMTMILGIRNGPTTGRQYWDGQPRVDLPPPYAQGYPPCTPRRRTSSPDRATGRSRRVDFLLTIPRTETLKRSSTPRVSEATGTCTDDTKRLPPFSCMGKPAAGIPLVYFQRSAFTV